MKRALVSISAAFILLAISASPAWSAPVASSFSPMKLQITVQMPD